MGDRIKLGQKVEDVVSGFTGIATGKNEWLNGCLQYCVVPRIDKDGKKESGTWIDEQQLKVVDDGILNTEGFLSKVQDVVDKLSKPKVAGQLSRVGGGYRNNPKG